ncbi:MAG: class I SAM-dependent methyltransferase [Phycisphaerae bacterium]|nr:class I SAM-dependent methyltransferase [Phycisphaerae bacterium]
MDKALYEEMYQLEQRHWWFAAKRRIVLALLAKFLCPHRPDSIGTMRVADLGCGCGMMLSDLVASGYDAVGVDASDLALEFCRARGVPAVKGRLPGRVDLPDASLDAVLMLDVLEHIDDDKGAFASAAKLLKPGGIAICTVPAYRWLWTGRDKFHHHKRRYSRQLFAQLLNSADNLQIIFVSFMNTFLSPLAFAQRLAIKALARDNKPTDLSIPRFGLNRLLQAIFQAERHFLIRRLCMPFGLSLVAVAQKLTPAGGTAAGDL